MDTQAQIQDIYTRLNSISASKDISRDNETSLRERLGIDTISASIPSGVISAFGGQTSPSGWLLCDGTQYQISQYANLYAIISTLYNTGGETAGYFRVPDCKTNVLAGYKSGDSNFGFFGATLGSASHSITLAEMPSHSHAGTYGSNVYNTAGANASSAFQGTSPVTLVTPGIISEGGGAAMKLIQPTLTVSFIIKT